MSSLSIFDKEPGTGLSSQIENIGRSALEVVRPQLFLIKEHFFDEEASKWPTDAFPGFIQFPLVAGYILGLVGAYVNFQNLKLSETDILKSVIDVHNHFLINELETEMSVYFMGQNSTFKFGLEIGAIEVEHYLTEQAQSGRSEYILLSLICKQFLQYDDAETLKLNLEIFCKMHSVPARDESTFGEIFEMWDDIKKYYMNLEA